MMAQPLPSRLHFLNEAAKLLKSSSPVIAAFLQSRIDEVAREDSLFDEGSNSKALTDQQLAVLDQIRNRNLDVCRACGHMSAQSPWSDDSTSILDPIVCQVCNSRSHPALLPEVKDAQETKQASSAPAPPSPAGNPPKPMDQIAKAQATPTGVKKAKGRKGGSLSAMLARSKQSGTSSQPGFGLDLLDLMKSS
jgi:hypothetical protein